jgi:hypothetical protein
VWEGCSLTENKYIVSSLLLDFLTAIANFMTVLFGTNMIFFLVFFVFLHLTGFLHMLQNIFNYCHRNRERILLTARLFMGKNLQKFTFKTKIIYIHQNNSHDLTDQHFIAVKSHSWTTRNCESLLLNNSSLIEPVNWLFLFSIVSQ